MLHKQFFSQLLPSHSFFSLCAFTKHLKATLSKGSLIFFYNSLIILKPFSRFATASLFFFFFWQIETPSCPYSLTSLAFRAVISFRHWWQQPSPVFFWSLSHQPAAVWLCMNIFPFFTQSATGLVVRKNPPFFSLFFQMFWHLVTESGVSWIDMQ